MMYMSGEGLCCDELGEVEVGHGCQDFREAGATEMKAWKRKEIRLT